MNLIRYEWGPMNHVYEALAQVRTIHRHILEKQRFRGYSGRARAVSGCVALAAAFWTAGHPTLDNPTRVFIWLGVAAIGAAVNYGAVLGWYLRDSSDARTAATLKPAVEFLPSLFVGALLTLILWWDRAYNLLPATWMLLFGLGNLSSRYVITRHIGWVGAFYIVAGTVVAFATPRTGLVNPWPMGLVFFVGEWLGGFIIHFDEREGAGWSTFWGLPLGTRTND